ncbi:MAG: right-handed parallel beta-helix repeat-containing protein [Clostridia bacterium]|nr:right-handed parallel beta-helix repeat-containing protein [Clostridia bacterium]
MKRILALLLVLCILLACCGCKLFGGKSAKKTSSKKNPSSQSDVLPDEDEWDEDADSEDKDNSSGDASDSSKKSGKGSVEVGGTAFKSAIELEEEDSSDNLPQSVESGTSVSTLKTPWDKVTLSHLNGSSDAEAEAMRNSVLGSGNTADIYPVTGTKYYVSPGGDDANDGTSPSSAIKTTDAIVTKLNLKAGDAVLFERGGVWRLSKAIKCKEGVAYGSYGTGEKPAFYGSPRNYADKKYWTASNLKNVWKLSISDIDIGLMVFDHGEMVGYKTTKGLLSLSKNGDFYYNRAQSTLYIYCDKGNPGKAYKDIEVCLNKAAFDITRVSGVTVDNIKIKYFGKFGVDLEAADNTKVSNCEIGFIGGASQNSTTRLGNAIQMWQGCDGHIVENCWVYQIYDTGITFQGNSIDPNARRLEGTHDEDYKNIIYRNNLIEYCALSIELWHGNHNDGLSGNNHKSYDYTDAVLDNIHIENNISRFAGYGWSSFAGQRPDPHGEHLIMYAHAFPYANNVYIENNIFDLCDAWICRWQFTTNYKEDTNDATCKKINGVIQPIVNKNGIWTIRNNTYYHGKNRTGGLNWYGYQKTGSGQTALNSAISSFDSSPKNVVWVD